MIAIEAGCVLTPFKEISPGMVTIKDGCIEAVKRSSEVSLPSNVEVIEEPCGTLVPGFIDTHTHGRDGLFFGETADATVRLCRSIVSTGVTSTLPTLCSLLPVRYSLEMILDSIRAVREAQQNNGGAEILGIHLEGPYLSSAETARGSQLASNMRDPSVEELESMVSASDRSIRKMTIAPELEGAHKVIREMTRHGIVPSVGHSAATFEQVLKAIEAGLRSATHTFNAMLPFHHRRPGLLGAVLIRDEISAELIADGEHVSVPAMQILLRCKGPERVHLVTDNAIWAGLPDGSYQSGDREVIKEGQRAYVKGGTLIGSVASMDQCVSNIVRLAGCSLSEAVRMASFNAALLIGCEHRKGSIEPGKDADLVILDDHLRVKMTMVKGSILHRRDN